MPDDRALRKYLNHLQKDKDGVLKLQEWIKNGSQGDSYNCANTNIYDQDEDESVAEDYDSEGYIGIVPTESGVMVNVLGSHYSRLVVTDGVNENHEGIALFKAMGYSDSYEYEEEDKNVVWDDASIAVKKEPDVEDYREGSEG